MGSMVRLHLKSVNILGGKIVADKLTALPWNFIYSSAPFLVWLISGVLHSLTKQYLLR
jgi:hypothetical protein